jgi:hypothetical protein
MANNAKTKEQKMSEETVAPTTEETTAPVGDQPESVNLTDLGTLLQIVDLATQRGAFRGSELTQVGAVFDKLNAFLSYIQEQQAEKADAENTEAPDTGE